MLNMYYQAFISVSRMNTNLILAIYRLQKVEALKTMKTNLTMTQ